MIPSISQTPSNTPSNTATVTPSGSACPVTPSLTASPTRTPTLTPSFTPFAVCPEQLTIVSTNNPLWSTGTYNRKYDYSGGTLIYGYFSTTLGYSVGTAPDGNNYPIFKSISDFDFLVRLFIGGTDFGFAQMSSTGDGWNGPVSGATVSQAQFYNYITISGARFPATGLQTANSYNHYLAYPEVCPTSTPTNTSTSTITPTPTSSTN